MSMKMGLSRRDLLRAGAAGVAGLPFAGLASAGPARDDINCIFLFLVGGPSQLDTWDPKPAAPSEVRGPFGAIRTAVPGIHLSENFPRMAALADRFAIVRSLHHPEAPIHETGQQLMQTGRLCGNHVEQPHFGSVVSLIRGQKRSEVPAFAVLPGPIGNTGVPISHGEGAGFLGARHEPSCPALPRHARPSSDDNKNGGGEGQGARGHSRYGDHPFGRSCLMARRLIEQGVRFVTVNMFDTVFDKVTWDCHAIGSSLGSTLNDYRTIVCPMFDQGFTALLEDLDQRGLLATTMVVAVGEFGRTPYLNTSGGRDHWPGAWSALFAGGRVRGGQVVGASDRIGAEPRDRRINPAQFAATIYEGLGIDLQTCLPGPDNRPIPLCDAAPVRELFV